ncbi:putative tubulin polyglutamylase ttll9 [Clonorchis sinensis]|uniref:Tubulin--tyrosine ligase-like protein 9 n=1 Tax=Clonorchis sinensis TaxID=79923 RepID=A0A8T1MCE8_CLOSI|nr:putative tubulin polyglutamylase ttll9 [Clonorchis sinensis]
MLKQLKSNAVNEGTPHTAKSGVRKGAPGSYIIKYKCTFTNTIGNVLRNRGWQEVSREDECEFYWCEPMTMKELFDHGLPTSLMKVCHFRNHHELTRKNLMVKNLKRFKKKYEKDYGKLEAQKIEFIPTTFELPAEYHMFIEAFRKSPGSIWIMKPIAKSQGKGIFLFRKLKDIEAWKRVGMTEQACGDILNRESPETYVVSRYIDNPYLVSERKFDLRVYVLVTSFSPLKAWVYRDGFARFSNTPFSLDTLDDQYVHLTNVAVQKTAPDYDSEKGCKWSVCKLRRFLQAQHGFAKVAELFNRIDMIFVISLLSVQKIMIQDKRCFELYGYDILIDNELKPWLLEINASPSLTASSKEDYILKCNLLDDMLDVVDLEGRLVGDEKRVGDFDLVWDDGPVSPTNRTTAGWIAEAMTVLKPSSNDNTTGSSGSVPFVLRPGGFPKLNSYLGCISSKPDSIKTRQKRSSAESKPTLVAQT